MILLALAFIPVNILRVTLDYSTFGFFAVSVLFLTASGYVINDIFDKETDRINKPETQFVSRVISVSHSKWLAVGLALTGLITGLYASSLVNELSYIFLLLVHFIIVFLYSAYLQRIAILGNLAIAICAFWIYVLIYWFFTKENSYASFLEALVGLLDKTFKILTLFLYGGFSFLITLIRELIKDIEDIDGDYNVGMKTLPIIIGVKRARNVVVFLSMFFALALSIVVGQLFYEEHWWMFAFLFVMMLIPFLYFLFLLWNTSEKAEFTYLSSLLKVIMILGIFSMLFLNDVYAV